MAFPVAPAILGMVLGNMLEDNFVTSDDQVGRKPADVLQPPHRGCDLRRRTIIILLWPVAAWLVRQCRGWLPHRRRTPPLFATTPHSDRLRPMTGR